jgi:hypothetical protein
VAPEKLTGTLQNDILKEFLARKAYVFPPRPSMRLAADVVEFATGALPRFNPISVTGYHAREAGCDAVTVLRGQLGDHPHRAAAAQQRDPLHRPVPGRGAGRCPVDPRHGL